MHKRELWSGEFGFRSLVWPRSTYRIERSSRRILRGGGGVSTTKITGSPWPLEQKPIYMVVIMRWGFLFSLNVNTKLKKKALGAQNFSKDKKVCFSEGQSFPSSIIKNVLWSFEVFPRGKLLLWLLLVWFAESRHFWWAAVRILPEFSTIFSISCIFKNH